MNARLDPPPATFCQMAALGDVSVGQARYLAKSGETGRTPTSLPQLKGRA